ncbi:MAG: hypothetical protein ACLFPD_06620 [Desulfosudaceae bacterium]
MKRVFDERDIEIPFPHQTVWFGTGKDGTAPPAYHAAVTKNPSRPSTGEPVEESAPVRIASESEVSKEVMRETDRKKDKDEK